MGQEAALGGAVWGAPVSPGSPAARALAACPLDSTDSGAAAGLWRASGSFAGD